MKLGIHAGPQDLSMEDLKRLWKIGDESGFHWISVWDHFYANPLQDRGNPCFEGVAALSGLATYTQNVRVGCLVFCALFRNPGVLAKAAVTIDHLSGGRADIGIGAGWLEEEFREFGYGFPPLGKRLDQLEEALTIISTLWSGAEVNFKGEYYDMQGAVCSPQPKGLRLWIGGRGKVRTIDFAARFADGFNMPYVPPEFAKDRLERLRKACDKHDRDFARIDTSVNLGFYMNSSRTPDIDPQGSLTGGVQQTIDLIGAFKDIGIQGINIAFRPPIDWENLQVYTEEVLPVFAK
ncbi:MAG: LLM class flavin-dependent oxidoreductase [Gammaproteobacteria bacterium]|nr:LLM class flavin-dependent oxidoreductase [Gammaproteobacteria bacterium]